MAVPVKLHDDKYNFDLYCKGHRELYEISTLSFHAYE